MSQKLSFFLAAALLSLPCCKSKDDGESKTVETPEAPAAEKAAADEPKAETAPKVEEAPAATQIETDDFTAPIPKGYKTFGPAKVADLSKKMGQKLVGILTKPRAEADHFVTSFIFTEVASTDIEPTKACDEAAEAIAKASGAKTETPKVVEFPFGKTCQFAMGDDKQRAIQTIAFVDKKFWMFTCNFDPRDEASPKECNEVLTGFAAK